MLNEQNKLLIYSPVITSRLEYIVKIIFQKLLGINYELTANKNVFEQASCPKFSYLPVNQHSDLKYLTANPLLTETGIHPMVPDVFVVNGYKAFFRTKEGSFFPFDIFAASFFLITRYEEYLPYKEDQHGRFSAEESLAYKHGFLEEPIIHIWAEMFKSCLIQYFPNLKPIKHQYKFLSTIDIDNAWAHLHKGFIRTLLSCGKLFLRFDFNGLCCKIKVLLKKSPDPYDNYEFINQVHTQSGIKPIYFILFSKFSRFDKNPSIKNHYFRELVQGIARTHDLGMHPSYISNNCFEILKNEKFQLENLVGKPIHNSRQHYLMLKMPMTYENLLKSGITRDFSMGYSSHVGFRAGFCMPYHFFNLKTNKETSLEIVPFAMMDVCFTDYLKIEPEIALKTIKKIISSIKKVDGLFVSLWHNETFSDKNWRRIFEQMIIEANDEDQVS